MTDWYTKDQPRARKILQRVPKDCQELAAAAMEQGFLIRNGGSDHVVLKPPIPGVPMVRVATTPSDWRHSRNFRRDLMGSGFKPDLAEQVVAAGDEKREQLRREQDEALVKGERMAERARSEAEAVARQEARERAKQLTAEASASFQAKEYERLWSVLTRPWQRALVALDKAGGTLPGYAVLFAKVYGEPMGTKHSRVQMLVRDLDRRGFITREKEGRDVTEISITSTGRAALQKVITEARIKVGVEEPVPVVSVEPVTAAAMNEQMVAPVLEPLPIVEDRSVAQLIEDGDHPSNATHVLRVIEALAEQLLEALDFKAVIEERDRLRVTVQRYEAAKDMQTLPKCGRMTALEVEAAEAVVMAMRKR